jgi:hypothetical protein
MATPITYAAYWDDRLERLQQPPTEAAVDIAAAQMGLAWTLMLYSSLR